MKTKTLKQKIFIKASSSKVYEALTNPALHSEFTGSKATGTDKLGKFTVFDGYAFGENIELKKNKKIVQTWSADDFPKGQFSEVIYELKEEKDGTTLNFTQKNLPAENYKSISDGWEEYYWKPLKKMLEK